MKSIKWIAIILAIVLVMIGIVIGAGYLVLRGTYTNEVAVEKAPDIVEVPKAEEKVDTTLTVIEGTPEDIGEDYHVELAPEEEPVQEAIYEQVQIDENVINILLVGQDSTMAKKASTRSDSCILVSYNREQHAVKMVSFMRDTWTPIPGRGWNRINAAYSYGGVGLLINTINQQFELDVQDYAIIGFEEFEKCVDQLGGLDITLTSKEANYINERNDSHLKEGENHINGKQALIHARNRRMGDGDFGRVTRQRDIILTAYQTLRAKGDVASYISFINYALSNMKTSIPPEEIINLAIEVLQTEDLQIAYRRIPYDDTWHYANKDGKSVLVIDFEENTDNLHEFLYGEKVE